MIRVILSESRPLLRRGLLATLADDDGIGVLATAATLAEALALDERHAPDVHLIGASLPPAGGEEATRLLVRSRADANVVIVAEGDPDGRERPCPAYRALAAGARGYLDHDAEPAETLRAVREVAAGRPYLSGPSLEAVIEEVRRLAAQQAALTPEQLTTLELVRRGLSNKEIAVACGVSQSTIKRRLHRLEATYRVHGRTRIAVRSLLLDGAPPVAAGSADHPPA